MYKIIPLFLALLFFNCTTDQTAGTATDFPNTIAYEDSVEIANLGTELNNNINISQNWNVLEDVPTIGTPATLITTDTTEQQQPMTLKTSLLTTPDIASATIDTLLDSSWADWSDTTNGIMHYYGIYEDQFTTRYDSLNFVYDEAYKQDPENNVILINAQTRSVSKIVTLTTHTSTVDTDGDGIISIDSTSANIITITATHYAPNYTKRTVSTIDPGADYNFDSSEDNNIFYYHEHTFNSQFDTLSFTQYLDADNDSIISNTNKDSSLVAVTLIKNNNLFTSHEHSTMYIYPMDSTKDHPVSYQKLVTHPFSSEESTIKHINDNTSFNPGDSVVIEKKTYRFFEGDTTSLQIDSIKVILDPTPGQEALNRGYFYKSTKTNFKTINNTDKNRETSFTLTPSTPLLDTEEFTYGDFSWNLTRFNSTEISLDGTVTPTGKTATVSIDERQFFIHWDADGTTDSITVIQ